MIFILWISAIAVSTYTFYHARRYFYEESRSIGILAAAIGFVCLLFPFFIKGIS